MSVDKPRKFSNLLLKSKKGFGLLEVLVASAIGVATIVMMVGSVTNLGKATRRVESVLSIAEIKKNVLESVSCDTTFLGRTRGNPCPTGEYIDLKSATKQEVVGKNGTVIDKWTVRAYCGSDGLDIRTMSLTPKYRSNLQDLDWIGKSAPTNPTHFRQDLLLKTPYSWAHPKSQIFKPGSLGLCAGWFGTSINSTACGPDEYAQNVNFDTKMHECRKIPNCSLPEVLTFNSAKGEFSCDKGKLFDSIKDYVDKSLAKIGVDTPSYEVIGLGDKQCAELARMVCDKGYFMWGYEALTDATASKKCRLRCKKLIP